MDTNKKILLQAYNPFLRLAIIQCFMYTLYLVIFFVVYIFAICYVAQIKNENFLLLLNFFPVYIALYLIAFRIPMLSLLEKRENKYEKILVKIDDMETDGLFGDYKGANQEIKYCYPSELEVERIKIVCSDANGKKYRLRMICSGKKIDKINTWFGNSQEYVYLIYGKYTKIILWIEWPNAKDKIKYDNVRLLNKRF